MLSKAFSIEYSACMKAQSTNSNWANQIENELFRLFYMMPLEGDSNINS